MANQTAFDFKDVISSKDVENVLKCFKVESDFISDLDFKVSSLITEDDIAMFD
jgi:hypothetical protein